MKVGDYVRTKYGISKICQDGRYVKNRSLEYDYVKSFKKDNL